MKASKTTSRIAIVLGTFAALVAFASSAQASSTTPAGMTQAEYAAVMARSEALDEQYGNAVTRLSPEQFEALSKAGGDRLEPQELVALMTRSQGLNDMYEPRDAFGPQGAGAIDPPTPVVSSSFGWSDAGIGAAAMLGFVLLTGGLFVAARHSRRVPTTRAS
jgi:hypothetical protein